MSTHMVHCGEQWDPAPQETAVGFFVLTSKGRQARQMRSVPDIEMSCAKGQGQDKPSATTRTEREASAEGGRKSEVWLQAWERGEDRHKSRLISLVEGCS